MSDHFDIALERKLESSAGAAGDGGSRVRRIELITGSWRRRQWSDDDKARIIVESLKPGANVSEVARRNGLSPQQLFAWRREARALFGESAGPTAHATPAERVDPTTARTQRRKTGKPPVEREGDAPAFAPIVIAAAAPPPPSLPPPDSASVIEIAIGDAVVRVIGQAESSMLITVLRAVRRSS